MIPSNLAELVTFVPNKTEPIHNWFYYKEGFAKKLVEWAIEEFKLEESILDCFCEVGTTLLTAKELDLKSIGFDASPLAAFVSEAKNPCSALFRMLGEKKRKSKGINRTIILLSLKGNMAD